MPKTLAQGQSMAWLRKRAILRGVASPPTGGGVPVLAWRYPDNSPVLKAGGGYWLKAS